MSPAHGSFSAPPQIQTFDGLLSDFDGTIVDSTDGKFQVQEPSLAVSRGTKLNVVDLTEQPSSSTGIGKIRWFANGL